MINEETKRQVFLLRRLMLKNAKWVYNKWASRKMANVKNKQKT